jgi:putative restriction endonuclease
LLWTLIARAGNPLQARDARATLVASAEEPEREVWERHVIDEIRQAPLDSTEREALVKARVGQGVFRANVARVEQECRITRVSNPVYLVASHIVGAHQEPRNSGRLADGLRIVRKLAGVAVHR